MIELLSANGVDLLYHICAGDNITIQMFWKYRKFKVVVSSANKSIELIFSFLTKHMNIDSYGEVQFWQITVASIGDIKDTLKKFIILNNYYGINEVRVTTIVYEAGKSTREFVLSASVQGVEGIKVWKR